MKTKVIREIAQYLDAPEYQVECWDGRLAQYFVENRQQFDLFRTVCPVTRYNVWLDGVRVAKRAPG